MYVCRYVRCACKFYEMFPVFVCALMPSIIQNITQGKGDLIKFWENAMAILHENKWYQADNGTEYVQ